MSHSHSERPDSAVTFTVDGKPFSTTDEHQTAAQVLTLAGLDPTLYDLTLKRSGGAPPKRIEDTEPVRIKDDDVYLSLRVRAEVA